MPDTFSHPTSINWYKDKLNERNTLSDDIHILSGIGNEQEKTLQQYGNVSGLWSGLLVLGYSTLVGIVIPTLLLPYPLNRYDDIATRKLLIVLFFSDLLSLFIYLGISIYKLTKKN